MANSCKVLRSGNSTIFSDDCRKQADGTYHVKVCTTGTDCVAKEIKEARNYRCPDTSPGGPMVCIPYGGKFKFEPALTGKVYLASEAKQAKASVSGDSKVMRFSVASDMELSAVLSTLAKKQELSDVFVVAEKEDEPKLICSLDGKSFSKLAEKDPPPSCDTLNVITSPKSDNPVPTSKKDEK